MGLIKLMVLIGIVIGLVILWRRFKAWQARSQQPRSAPANPLLMVRCAHCQVHLPQDQAVRLGNQWYCCAAHRDAEQHD